MRMGQQVQRQLGPAGAVTFGRRRRGGAPRHPKVGLSACRTHLSSVPGRRTSTPSDTPTTALISEPMDRLIVAFPPTRSSRSAAYLPLTLPLTPTAACSRFAPLRQRLELAPHGRVDLRLVGRLRREAAVGAGDHVLAPDDRANRRCARAISSGCSTMLDPWVMTPGMSTLPSGSLTRSQRWYSCSWRALAASKVYAPALTLSIRRDQVAERRLVDTRSLVDAVARVVAHPLGRNAFQSALTAATYSSPCSRHSSLGRAANTRTFRTGTDRRSAGRSRHRRWPGTRLQRVPRRERNSSSDVVVLVLRRRRWVRPRA